MALVISCALSSHHGVHLGRGNNHGRNKNATLLRLSSASQWPSRSLGYPPTAISSKRICSLDPRSSAAAGISSGGEDVKPGKQILTKESFGEDFVFGAATSSYQIEGAWNEGGKGPSIWDHYCHTYPDRIKENANGDDAVNSYHMYEDDVKMLKDMGMTAYRFSICWPRILPNGNIQGGINKEGIEYYNNLINELKNNGIEPYVMLFHWETPQALEEKYRSFLSRDIVDDFTDFAEVCFENFGDRVKHWFTFNEPYVFCNNAYGIGKHAPGRCSEGRNCAVPSGDSLVEPYKAGHNLLLAHAKAVGLYKDKFQKHQQGKIGIALVSMGYEAFEDKHHLHLQARDRCIDFNVGWFLEPLVHGDYPFTMRALVKDRLPEFTSREQKLITGSFDMLGLNYYTSRFSPNVSLSPSSKPSLNTDDCYADHEIRDTRGEQIGTNTGARWLHSYPEGLKNLLLYIKDRYNNPLIYITENGIGDMDDGSQTMEHFLNDTTRLEYLKDHLAKLKEAKESGCNVRGHFTWSLVDNFEWHNGYTERFGLVHVDRDNGYKRTMKNSAKWFAEFNGVKENPAEGNGAIGISDKSVEEDAGKKANAKRVPFANSM